MQGIGLGQSLKTADLAYGQAVDLTRRARRPQYAHDEVCLIFQVLIKKLQYDTLFHIDGFSEVC